jgi:hypothetical protein
LFKPTSFLVLTTAEKANLQRLLKNAQMQGFSFGKLRINSPEE